MIIKIGLALMVCVAIPAFVVGILIILAGQDPEEEQKQICGTCDHCYKFGESMYLCLNEQSQWYDKETVYEEDGCSLWENL